MLAHKYAYIAVIYLSLLSASCMGQGRDDDAHQFSSDPDVARDDFMQYIRVFEAVVKTYRAEVVVEDGKQRSKGLMIVILPKTFYVRFDAVEVLRTEGGQFLKVDDRWISQPLSDHYPISPLNPVEIYSSGSSLNNLTIRRRGARKINDDECEMFEIRSPGKTSYETYCFTLNGILLEYVTDDGDGHKSIFHYSDFNAPVILKVPSDVVVPTSTPPALRQ